MKKTILVRYGELALKSRPVRRQFERLLEKNIKSALHGVAYELRRERGRIFISTRSIRRVIKHLIQVPGISSVSPTFESNAIIDDICSNATKAAKLVLKPGQSFAVRTRRVGIHEFTSTEVNMAVGSEILKAVPGVRVDLSNPDHEISIEVRDRNAYVFTEKASGPGGLPVGSEGNVVVLLSGGMDSAVAAYLMMKRGCRIFPVFMDNRPYADRRVQTKVTSVAKKLAEFQPKLGLRFVPHGRILKSFIEKAPHELICVLCKRAMLRVADAIAGKVGAEAVVTGESLGQVASQTLTNLRVIDEACELPVLRPLIGLDKVEIEQMARRIGTFEISARPAVPCTAVPPHPRTQAKLAEVRKIENRLDSSSLVKSTLRGIRIFRL